MAGSESNIDIYLRMRPMSSGKASYEVDHEEHRVDWHMPRQISAGIGNHQREHYTFGFNGIFDPDAKQDLVFETAARKVVLAALDGFNGTIFAYGQTGSGKTYTITGGAERYVDRGIIPRAVSLMFSEISNRSDHMYTLHFSYLEIYNETGYDLLNPDHEIKALEDLPKVLLLEDDENHIHLRNLSTHLATNEEEALNLLFMGDTNRMISSTPMNMASSRSHCIFTASIEARKAGEDTVRKSKLHLVDLAGSERVSKTGVDGQILREAKYINLSLHFLEQVIIALQERSQGKQRAHIPYRNSMMTSVLRDSLGGNCRTVMIATVSVAQDQLDETISTCRFAQRVALVSNKVVINEEVDPNIVIKRLKQEVKDLKAEIHLLRGEDSDAGPLTDIEIASLQNQVKNYINDPSPEATFNCGGSMMAIQAAFRIFKGLFHAPSDKFLQKSDSDITVNGQIIGSGNDSTLHDTIKNLYHQLQQRDNEINILVSFIRKREAGISRAHVSTQVEAHDSYNEGKTQDFCRESGSITPCRSGSVSGFVSPSLSVRSSLMEFRPSFTSDKKEAFNLFWKNYPNADAIEENKLLLKTKYNEAKLLGEEANKSREKINGLKVRIEKHRVENALEDLVRGTDTSTILDPEEDKLIMLIEKEKKVYKEGFTRLRDLKREIENLQLLLEQGRTRVQADFEQWFSVVSRTSSCQSPMFSSRASSVETYSSPAPQADRIKHSNTISRFQVAHEPVGIETYIPNKLMAGGGNDSNVHAHRNQTSFQESPTSLTGNASTDADILAFYKARSNIMQTHIGSCG